MKRFDLSADDNRKKLLKILLPVAVILLAAVLLCIFLPEFLSKNDDPQTDNLLRNSDFSSVDDAGIPDHWYTDAWYQSADVSEYGIFTDDAGEKWFYIINHSENDARLAQHVEVEPDSYYCLKGTVFAEADGGRGANLSIAGLYCFSEPVYSSGPSGEKIEYWGKTSHSQTDITVFLRLGGYGGESSGYAYFSDVSLTKYEELPEGVRADNWYSYEDSWDSGTEEEKKTTALSSSVAMIFSVLFYIIIADILLVWARYEKRGLTGGFAKAEYIVAFIVLAAAVAVRILTAIRVPGYDIDVNDFSAWAVDMKRLGASGFYAKTGFCDYPPGYLLVLLLTALFGEPSLLAIKMPSIVCDVILAAIIIAEGRKYTTHRKALVMGLIYLMCPVTVCTGAAWGQSDAVMTLFLGISVFLLLRHNWAAALPVYTVSVLMKPQALMFGPLGVAALVLDIVLTAVRRHKDKAAFPEKENKTVSALGKRLISVAVGFAASAMILGIVTLLFTDMTALKQGIGVRTPVRSDGEIRVAYTFECDSVSVSFHDPETAVPGMSEEAFTANQKEKEIREDEAARLLNGTVIYCYTDGSVSMMNGGELLRKGTWSAENGVMYMDIDGSQYQISDIHKGYDAPYLYDQYIAEQEPYVSCYRLNCYIDTDDMLCRFTFSCCGQSPDWLIKLYIRTLSSYDFCTVNGCNLAFLAGENWQEAETTPVSSLVMILSRLVFILPLLMCYAGRKKERRFRRVSLYLIIVLITLGESLLWLFLKTRDTGIMSGDWGTAMIVLSVIFTLWLLVQGKYMKHLPLTAAVLLLLLFNTGTKMHERYLFPALMLLVIAFIVEKDRRIIWLLLGVSAFSLMNVGCVLDRNIRIGGAEGHLSTPAFALDSDMDLLEYMSAVGNYLCTILGVWIASDLCLLGSDPWKLAPYKRENSRALLRDALTGENTAASGNGKKEMLTGSGKHTGRMGGMDWIIVGVITLAYGIFALINLGSMKAPQTEYTVRNTAVFDLGESREFSLKIYMEPDYISGRLMIYAGEDDTGFELCMDKSISSMEGMCWKTISDPSFRGRYLKIDFSKCYAANIGEIICCDANTGDRIPLTLVSGYSGHSALCDEQELPDMPSEGLLALTLAEPVDAFRPSPESFYDPEWDGSTITFDLGEHRDFKVLYYSGIQWREAYSCEMTVSDTLNDDDDGSSYGFESQDGDCFAWKYVYDRNEIMSGRYLSLNVTDCLDMSLFEIICRDAVTNEPIPLTLISGPAEAAALCDEPYSLEGEPSWWNSTYFDEIYHARTAYEHLHGLQVYETTHPPLGKVIMSWSVGIFGMCPFGWRLPGALCGVFMLPAIYMIARLLMKKRRWAVGAALLLAFDCMHYTQTRIATIDSYVVLFILWSVYFMFYWMKQDYFNTKYWKTFVPLLASGVFMGLSVASKWTGCYNGIGLAILFFVTWIWRFVQVCKARSMARGDELADCDDETVQRIMKTARWGHLKLFGTLISCILFFIIIPLTIYYLSYIPYFVYDGGITVEKVIEAAVGKYFITGEVGGMLGYHSTPGLGMDHYFYSPWYEWPIDAKPMWFYSGTYGYDSDVGSTIMTMGNPAVWWGGLLAMLIMIVMVYVYCRYQWSRRGALTPAALRDNHGMQWLLVVFAAQFLPWTLVPRGTYIYHYFACVPVIILASMCVLSVSEELCEARRTEKQIRQYAENEPDIGGTAAAGWKNRIKGLLLRVKPRIFLIILIAYVIISLVMFIRFYPYASGKETGKEWLDSMKWFDNWLWY